MMTMHVFVGAGPANLHLALNVQCPSKDHTERKLFQRRGTCRRCDRLATR